MNTIDIIEGTGMRKNYYRSPVDTHGLRMKGIRSACHQSHGLSPQNPKLFVVYYRMDDEEIILREKYWSAKKFLRKAKKSTVTRDLQTVRCGYMIAPMTMQQIADWVAQRVSDHERETTEILNTDGGDKGAYIANTGA